MSGVDLGPLRAAAAAAVSGGRAADASHMLERILALVPDDPAALGMLGVVQVQLGQLAEAERTLTRAAALSPGDQAIRFNLGCARRVLDLPGAAAEFEAVLSLNDRHLGAMMNLADLFLEAGAAEAARLAYARAAELAPRIPEPLLGIARAANALQAFEEAEAACRRAIAVVPGFAQAWIALGRAHLGRHRLQDAEAAFRQALGFAGGNPDVIATVRELLVSIGAEDGR